jgi:hypothetical protein
MSPLKSINAKKRRKVNVRAEGHVCSFELNAKRRTIEYIKKKQKTKTTTMQKKKKKNAKARNFTIALLSVNSERH